MTRQEFEKFRYSTVFRKCSNCDEISYTGIFIYKKRNDKIILCQKCYHELKIKLLEKEKENILLKGKETSKKISELINIIYRGEKW